MKAKEWKTVRGDVPAYSHKYTRKHSYSHSHSIVLIHMQLSLLCSGEGVGWLCSMRCITPKFTFIHTHTLTRTHSVCLCPIWYPLKRFTCPSAPCPAICNLHAKCIGWVHGWVCECASECVGECIVNRSVYRCAFDLQFVSLASFLALSSDSFYVRFGHSCNFNLPEVVRRGYSHS